MVRMCRQHHAEKGFTFPVNTARVSVTLSNAIASPDALALVADHGMLLATCFDSPFGAGRVAVEQMVRATRPHLFNEFLEHFEHWARSRECASISLSCTDRHAAFARLYGRRGYSLAESTFSKAL